MAVAASKPAIVEHYVAGGSVNEVAKAHGVSPSTVRLAALHAGVLRSRTEGVRLAAQQGRMGRHGPRGPLSEQARENMREARRRYFEANPPAGVSLKADGYVDVTTGPNKNRGAHVVIAERMLGRRLHADECVHHIDHNPSNNKPENLQVMTRKAHSRLHAIENLHSRKRNDKGQFS